MDLDFYTVEQKILKKLDDQGASCSWLSRQTGISVPHLHNILKGKGDWKKKLSEENLTKINDALKTEFKLND